MANAEILTKEQRQSAVWLIIKKTLEERLESLRRKNDGLSLTDDQARGLRYRIAEVKALMSMGEDRPIVFDEDQLFRD